MANNRKLQSEIDRLMKKVQEGIEEFDNILSKVYAATSANQKEKYEQDLKREIKKLQRSRDQIKTWIASTEVKQKNQLVEARKLIETKMEQFKTCEKDSKTKAFSKEGLSMAVQQTDEKHEVRQWIKSTIKELHNQIDQFEVEIETVPPKKRTGNSQVEKLQENVEHHKFHINKLEKVLRNLENDTISVDQVNEVKDTVDYYTENHQDPDFMWDDTVYDGIPMKEDDDRPPVPGLLRSSGDFSNEGSAASDEESENLSQGSNSSNNSSNSKETPTPPPVQVPVKAAPKKTTEPPAPVKNSLSSSGNIPVDKKAPVKEPTPVPEKKTTLPPPEKPTKPLTELFKQPQKQTQAPPQSQAVHPQDHAQDQSQRAQGTPASKRAATTPPPATVIANAQQTKPTKTAQAPIQPPAQTPAPSSADGKAKKDGEPEQPFNRANPTIQYSQFTRNASQQQQTLQQALHPAVSTTNEKARTSTTPPPQPQSSAPVAPSQEVPKATVSQPAQLPPSNPPQQASVPANPPQTMQPVQVPFPPLNAQEPQSMDNKELTNMTFNFEQYEEKYENYADVANVEPGMLGEFSQMNMDAHNSMQMLESSMRNIPEPMDSERPKQYTPRNPWQAPGYYPQSPLPMFDNPQLFEKFDTDTLFFIFYYQQGTYQQYLAAKELKKQSWRYHKKYLTWFQRHEEPKEITNEYEQGTYVYFDYETGWCQRKKTEFTFEYRFLEDYD